jgi:hypothetical protein
MCDIINTPGSPVLGSTWLNVEERKKFKWTEDGWVEVVPRKIVCFFSNHRRLSEYRDWAMKQLVAKNEVNPTMIIHTETTIKTDELEFILLVHNYNNNYGYRPNEIRVDSELKVKEFMRLLLLVDGDINRATVI